MNDWPTDLLPRAGRQAVQVVTPALVAIAATGQGIGQDEALGLLLTAAVGAVIVVLKSAAGIVTDPTDPWWQQAVERTTSAGAAALLGYITVGPAVDLLRLDWPTIGWAVGGAMAVALAAMVTNPPATSRVVILDEDRGAANEPGDVGQASVALITFTAVMLASIAVGLIAAIGVTTAARSHAWTCQPPACADVRPAWPQRKPWEQRVRPRLELPRPWDRYVRPPAGRNWHVA